MQKSKVIFLSFFGIVLAAMAVLMMVSSAAAQGCYDPQTGKQIPCPPSGGNGDKNKRKTKTPTPVPPTPVVTATPVVPSNYPVPYPYPYPNPGTGGIATLPVPVGICVFCDRPWLWGLGGVIASIIVVGLYFLYLRFNPIGGGDPAPGDGELLPAVQKVNSISQSPGSLGETAPGPPDLPSKPGA